MSKKSKRKKRLLHPSNLDSGYYDDLGVNLFDDEDSTSTTEDSTSSLTSTQSTTSPPTAADIETVAGWCEELGEPEKAERVRDIAAPPKALDELELLFRQISNMGYSDRVELRERLGW